MQWGQIKMLFIFSFLVLDLFLLQQFLTKQEEASIGTIEEPMFEESPAEDNITIDDDIPEEAPEVNFLIASHSDFSESQLDQIERLEDQQAEVYGSQLLVSTLDEPVELGNNEESITETVSEHVPFSDQYSYWGLNEEEDKVLFFQTTNSRTVYYNSAGVLMVDIEDGQMTGYQLSQLQEEENENDDERELLDPDDVIDILYEDREISSGDEVTNMTVGYHSAAGFEPTQVFAPIWKVTINGEEDLFLNAVTGEGQVLDLEEDEFISDTLEYFQETISSNRQDVINNEEEEEENSDE
ncbi:two-component system regulatory protein YycI [Halobacillus sp. A5]|uniref:two-component system regulatory protein YycI n=1 Tax=Halobacillus sp. A5 TaxID=2880263 RepID=UPI0020A65B40|nr:two-component system regulatory protein YycI [Halobacillus sp. A5]MCP3026997.1 two-component system regulatory protein YycI [Halobacillus sp. A5]